MRRIRRPAGTRGAGTGLSGGALPLVDDGQLQRAITLGSRILELCVAVGGTVTGEHGVGVEKLNEMCFQFSDAELSRFHAVKAAFDPRRLLNPGKAIPTLNRCAEFGAMHVHGGRLAHPGLERF